MGKVLEMKKEGIANKGDVWRGMQTVYRERERERERHEFFLALTHVVLRTLLLLITITATFSSTVSERRSK
jgi:hypothetical protein